MQPKTTEEVLRNQAETIARMAEKIDNMAQDIDEIKLSFKSAGSRIGKLESWQSEERGAKKTFASVIGVAGTLAGYIVSYLMH